MPARRYPDWDSFEFPGAEPAGLGHNPGDGPPDGRVAVCGPPDAPVAVSGPPDAPVALCGDLSAASVLAACRRGIIPMPAPGEFFRTRNEVLYEDQVAAGAIAIVGDSDDDPYSVAWWSPDPRPVIADGVHIGRNTRKQLRRDALTTTANTAFGRVAEECRAGREPRWLTDALLGSLAELHEQGWAHSIEVWLDGDLAGGAIGIGMGAVISGDSLFARRPGASAVAVADMWDRLASAGGALIDAQWDTPFLRSLGAELVPRDRYLKQLGHPSEPVPLPAGPREARRLLPAPPP
jgi:leucyl/phenylalanyl-tRNA---protein transferase